MSIVRANKIQDLNGSTYHVPVQIVRTSVGTTGTISNSLVNADPAWAIATTTTTWTDYNYLQLTITPKFSTSIIRLELPYFTNNSGNSNNAAIRIVRGTNIVWQPMHNSVGPYGVGHSTNSALYMTQTIVCYDTPNTVSPITYIIQYRAYSNTNTVRLFAHPGATEYGPITTFTAMEFAQ